MHRLLSKFHDFRHSVFPSWRAQFEKLAHGQRPSTLFITCADSRVVPQMLTQTGPGELFILRNAGNIVPPYSAMPSGEAATIEYAVQVLKLEDIIVCGHSHCGAISGVLRPQLVEGLSAVEHWLTYAQQAGQEIAQQQLAIQDCDDELTTAIKTNVFIQLNNLRTYPAVADAEMAGNLRVHGCFYRFETGEVTALDESQRRFVSIEELLGTAAPALA
jgi:carbonic anhydrase